jgi:hypothetical protein
MKDLLERHPFLPILGVKATVPDKDKEKEEKDKEEDAALLLLRRVQLLLTCLRLPLAGCEVVLDLPYLRGEQEPPRVCGGSRSVLPCGGQAYTAVPGYLSERFPRSEGWDQVAAFLWLDPLTFYTCPLLMLSSAETARMDWRKAFEELGEAYEVLS